MAADTNITGRPGQQALRRGRVSIPSQTYVLTTITEQRNPLFADLFIGRRVVREMRRLHHDRELESLAYVIMPDHLHWLFVLGERSTLSQVAQSLKGRSAHAMTAMVAKPVWQRGYYDHALRREEDLRRLARYIVANPIRAGLVTNIGDYPLWDAVWLDDTLSG